MTRFRKRPVAIDAMQWDGTARGAGPIIDWALTHGGTVRYHDDVVDYGHDVQPGDTIDRDEFLAVDTLEGVMKARTGDWIIRGVKGEFYPCKPDIFRATYEEIP